MEEEIDARTVDCVKSEDIVELELAKEIWPNPIQFRGEVSSSACSLRGR